MGVVREPQEDPDFWRREDGPAYFSWGHVGGGRLRIGAGDLLRGPQVPLRGEADRPRRLRAGRGGEEVPGAGGGGMKDEGAWRFGEGLLFLCFSPKE